MEGEPAAQSKDVSREIEASGGFERLGDDIRDFLEGLLEAMELDGSVEVVQRAQDVADATISGPDAGLLIGRKGKTLDAIQELLRAAVKKQFGFGLKVSLDIEGYRERRKQAVGEIAQDMIDEALDQGEAVLEPMSAYERKIVHDIVAEREGVSSFSEGEDPERRVVIRSTGSQTD